MMTATWKMGENLYTTVGMLQSHSLGLLQMDLVNFFPFFYLI